MPSTRPTSRAAAVLALLVAALGAGCDSDTTSSVTSPSPTASTETFAGSLTSSATTSHQFAVTATGVVTVTLTSVSPLSTMGLGVQISSWDGTTCGTVVAQNANGRSGTAALSGSAAAGNYCVQVYDSGNVPTDWQVDYTVEVLHP